MLTFTDPFGPNVYEGATIETQENEAGQYFRATIVRDTDASEPWKEHDGHGIIRKVSRFDEGDKAPGERILYLGNSREYTFIYDWAQTMRIAKRDGWGCGTASHTHATPGERVACAVQADFDLLRGWITDQWCWVGVVVSIHYRDADGREQTIDDHAESLWGIDSLNENEYLRDVANELLPSAQTVLRALDRATHIRTFD